MTKFKAMKGVFTEFVREIKEEWNEMDNKALKISMGVAGLIFAFLLWVFVFRNLLPF